MTQSRCWHGALGVALPFLLQAQTPTPIKLSPGVTGPAFIKIEAVRELLDGRTLVTDRKDRVITIVDWNTMETRQVGRAGDGPGEYRYPRFLIPLKGDSTLATDVQNGKWYLLHRDRITTTLTRDRPLPQFVGVRPSADTLGRFLVLRGTRFLDGVIGRGGADSYRRSDSAAVILVNRDNVKADTLAIIRGPSGRTTRVRGRADGMTIVYMLGNPLKAGDLAVLFPDGWIATVFVSPYRVNWRSPSGAVVEGRPLPYASQPTNDRIKRQAIDDVWAQPGSTAPRFELTDFPPWPDVVPPFLDDALLTMPDGKLAIRRTSLGSDRTIQYDIVDRQGKLAGIVRLPPNERIMTFGARSVYVVSVDSDGNEILRRHPWP